MSGIVHSQLNDQVILSQDVGALTLIRVNDSTASSFPSINGLHAQLCVEYIHPESHQRVTKICHLARCFPKIAILNGPNPRVMCVEQGRTWQVPYRKIANMLTYLEAHQDRPAFDIYGQHKYSNVLLRMVGFAKRYNCCSFALELMYYAGVKYLVDGFNLVTFTPSFTKEDAAATQELGIKDCCLFAAEGLKDMIRVNFANAFDMNRLCQDASVGPVETFLGVYTPLALACAYCHYETVKLLVENYGADPTLFSGRDKDHDAIACASRTYTGLTQDPDQKRQIIEYLKRHNLQQCVQQHPDQVSLSNRMNRLEAQLRELTDETP